MPKQFWKPQYQKWFGYKNPEINAIAKNLGFADIGRPEFVDNIVKISFSDASLEQTKQNLDRLGISLSDFYAMNKHGMRCEEFTNKHSSKHVLFAGCSITVGEGIPLEYTWSRLVYSQLSKNEKLSGYFNISNPGFTIIGIVWQLFSYFNKFGNPDILFLNLPDIDREIRVVKSDDPSNESISNEFSGMLYYAYYSQLTKYCLDNNIKLYAFSWDYQDSPVTKIKDVRYLFDCFYMPTLEDKWQHDNAFDVKSLGKYQEFADIALDGAHPGIREHDFLASYIYNIYKEKNEKN